MYIMVCEKARKNFVTQGRLYLLIEENKQIRLLHQKKLAIYFHYDENMKQKYTIQ